VPYRWLAQRSNRYAKQIIAVWMVCFVLFGFYAGKLPEVLKDHGLWTPGYRETRDELAAHYGITAEPVILLFEKHKPVSSASFDRFVRNTLTRLKDTPGLRQIQYHPGLEGAARGRFVYAVLSFAPEFKDWHHAIATIREKLPTDDRITVTPTGPPVVQEDVNETSRSDLRSAETFGIPLAFLVLLMAFGGVVSALIPVITGFVAVTVTMGILYGVGSHSELSVFVLNVIPMVGLALSIDFALLVVGRYREEAERFPPGEALVRAMDTAGRAVTVSSLCVALGLAGTLWIPMPMFRSIAIGALCVLGVSWLMNVTFVPALLSLAGDKVRSERRASRRPIESNLWFRLSGMIIRTPLRILIVSSCFLAMCLIPLPKMGLVIPDASSLPADFVSRQASETWEQLYQPPDRSQVYLLTEGRESAVYIHRLLAQDTRLTGFQPVISKIRKEETLFVVSLGHSAESADASEWVREMKVRSNGYLVRFAGQPVYEQEVRDGLLQAVRYGIPFLVLINYVLLLIAFHSFVLPLKAIALNLLTIAASLGIMTWIFQEGRFGIEPSGIAVMIPVFVFGLAFGVSMDYGVFLLSRISEIYRRIGDNDRAVQEGLARTGTIITSAAAILISVTFPFVWGGVAGVRQLGVGLTAAILLDATIVRMLLVPALMKLLGGWNWRGP
jgi:putative drug exporter of the RND superfamily